MTDFYQFLTGRPSPGGRARVPVLDYLADPDSRPDVQRAGSRGAAVRESARPREAPRWASDVAAQRARTVVQRPSTPPQAAEPDPEVGTVPVAPDFDTERLPLSVAADREQDAPYGDDFVEWLRTSRGGELPIWAMPGYREEPLPEGLPPLSTGHQANAPSGLEDTVTVANGQTVRLAPVSDEWDAERRAGRTPMPDGATERWIAAEEAMMAERRAYDRERSGNRTRYDVMFRIIFGNQTPRSRVQRETDEMRERIREGDF